MLTMSALPRETREIATGGGGPCGASTGSVLGQGLRPQGAEPLPGADVADGHGKPSAVQQHVAGNKVPAHMLACPHTCGQAT